MHPKIRPYLTIKDVGDESLVLDLQTEQIHQLNSTAAWILAQCDGLNSVESISRNFAETFSLDLETAVSDVTMAIEQLCKIDVIDFNRD